MNPIFISAYILGSIMMISLFYKMWYHIFLAKNGDNMPSIVFYFYKYFPLNILLPLRQRPNNEKDNKLRKKANIALFIFYGSAIIFFLVSTFFEREIFKLKH